MTSLAALPVFVFALAFGGWWLAGVLLILSFIGLREFMKAANVEHMYSRSAAISFTIALYASINIWVINVTSALLLFLAMFFAFSCVQTVVAHKTLNIKDTSLSFFGFVYVPVLLSSIFYLRELGGEIGAWWPVAMVFVAAWGCDTGAYFVGRLLGKKKLAPNLSPKKTWAGAIGGTITAGVLCAVIAMISLEFNWAHIVIFGAIGLLLAIVAQVGDLFASALKRQFGVKDFGNLLPGHGGVLDRFDSILLAAPVFYVIAYELVKVIY